MNRIILCGSNILRIVPEMHAAERRTWNSKPSEDTNVTKAEGVLEPATGAPFVKV